MTPVAIAFGSNLGERARNVEEALRRLERVVAVSRVSSLYETEPMYVQDQPPFLNGVAVGETGLGPIALVAALKQIEREVGRTPAQRNGPREIDLDLVLYGSAKFSSNGSVAVAVPHPRLAERRFVLEPLAEAWPGARVPFLGPVCELLAREDVAAQRVRRWDAAVPLPGAQ